MALRSARDLNRRIVGVVSIVVILAAVAGAFAVGTLGLLDDRYEMSGVFSETAGLASGSKVRLAGVDVGEVTGVEPDFDAGQIVVTWEVDRGVHVGSDARAEIAIATLLGGQYLRLDDTAGGTSYADLPVEERRIPIARTRVPHTIVSAVGDTTRAVGALDTDAINAVVADLAGLSERDGAALNRLVQDLGAVADAINQRDADLARLVENGQRVSATLASRDQQLLALLQHADVLLDQLVARRGELATILGDGSEAVQSLARVVEDNEAALDAMLADFHQISGVVQRQLPNINTSLAWAGPTYQDLSRTSHGPWQDVVVYGLGPLSADVLADALGLVRP